MSDKTDCIQGKKNKELDQLERRLHKLQAQHCSHPKKSVSAAKNVKNASQGMKIATDLVAAIAVGAFLGWGLDKLLNVFPLFFIVFLLLGMGAGILNAYRTITEFENQLRQNRGK